MFHLVYITLYFIQSVKLEITETLVLQPDALEDTTLYTFMTRKPLFRKYGPVFMRRVYDVTNPSTTETIQFNETTSVNNISLQSNVSDVTEMSIAVTNFVSITLTVTETPPKSYVASITNLVYPSTTIKPVTRSETPFVTPMNTPFYQYGTTVELRVHTPESKAQMYVSMVTPEKTVEILRIRTPEKKEEQTLDKPEATTHQDVATGVLDEAGTEPFSTFLRKLMKVLSSKNLADLRRLIKPFENYVTMLVDSGKLMKLGSAISSYIAQETPLLRIPTDEIRRQFFIGQISLEYRRKMLTEGVNAMLDDMDDVYDVSEEEAMQRVLHEVAMFPDTNKTGEQIVKGFVDDVFLHPMHRIAGTTRGRIIFESITKIASEYNIPYDYARRFQENKYNRNTFKEPHALGNDIDRSTPYHNRNSKVRRFRERYSNSERLDRRYDKETDVGNTFLDSSSVSEDRSMRYHQKINKERKLVIPISVSQNLRGLRRDRNKNFNKKKLHSYSLSESEDSNNDNDGIEIRIKVNNGRYSTANKMMRSNIDTNKKENISVVIRNSGKHDIKERDSLNTKKGQVENAPLINNANRRSASNKQSNADHYFANLGSDINRKKVRESLGIGTGDEKAIARKSADSIRNGRKKTTNKNHVFFDYTDPKNANKAHKFLAKDKIDSDLKNKVGRRNTKRKTKVKYDCKPLPIIAGDKTGISRTKNDAGGAFSELLIYCDRASNVSSV